MSNRPGAIPTTTRNIVIRTKGNEHAEFEVIWPDCGINGISKKTQNDDLLAIVEARLRARPELPEAVQAVTYIERARRVLAESETHIELIARGLEGS